MNTDTIALRFARADDLSEVLSLIRELAAYERANGEVTVTLEELVEDGFGEHPLFRIILAVDREKILGMAFFFISYSTWKGKCLYLEDIIVREAYRGNGIGTQLFDEVIRLSYTMGAKRLQWQVLDWNTPAIRFYEKYDADIDRTWLDGKLTRAQLSKAMEKINGAPDL